MEKEGWLEGLGLVMKAQETYYYLCVKWPNWEMKWLQVHKINITSQNWPGQSDFSHMHLQPWKACVQARVFAYQAPLLFSVTNVPILRRFWLP